MAAAPKKKKTSQPAKKNTRTPPPPAPTYGREIAGGVCLLLALCAVVSYFQEEALFITFFGGLLKGLLGYGYWLSAPALLLTGLLLLTHRDRPATLRSVCTLLVPVLTGCGLHLLLCARSYEPGLTGLRELWLSGRSLQSGGALSGGLAVGFSAVFGKVLSLILFLLMLLAALCLALHISPKDAVRRAQERREAEREDIPEEAPPIREKEKPAEKRPRRRAAIDIPLDDEPPANQPQLRPEEPTFAPKEKKPFFSRKSSAVRTPDQVLRGEPAEEATPVAPAFLEKYYIFHKEKELKSSFDQVRLICEKQGDSSDDAYVQFEKICANGNINMLIAAQDRNLIWSSYSSAQRFQMQMEDWLYGSDRSRVQVLSSGKDYTLLRQTDERLQSEYLVLLGTLKNGNNLYMRAAVESIRESASITNQFFVMVSTGAIILSVILIIVLSKGISHPIHALSDIARRMTQLDFDAKYIPAPSGWDWSGWL